MHEEKHMHHHHQVLIKVPVVVGIGDCQALVVTKIPLHPPAFEIKDIDKKVIVDQCHVVKNKVIINATLYKNINYKTFGHKDEFDGNERVCGDLRHCTVRIPFACFIEIPGAKEGQDCQIECAEVEGEKDELLDENKDCTYSTLLEKTIVKIVAKVTYTDQIWIDPAMKAIAAADA
jgi:hypothetical protein